MKSYTIHFLITTRYNECISHKTYKRTSKKSANQLVIELSKDVKCHNSLKTNTEGFKYFDKLDNAGDFYRMAFIRQRTVKSKKTSKTKKTCQQ